MPSFTTLTICDAGENHAGNQIIGQKLERGIAYETLRAAFCNLNAQSEANGEEEVAARLHSIKELSGLAASDAVPDAHVLVIRDGVNKLTSGNIGEVKRELLEKEVDIKDMLLEQIERMDYDKAYFEKYPDAPRTYDKAYLEKYPDAPRTYDEAYFEKYPDAPRTCDKA